MTAEEYLDYLIETAKTSASFPVHVSELEALKKLIEKEKNGN